MDLRALSILYGNQSTGRREQYDGAVWSQVHGHCGVHGVRVGGRRRLLDLRRRFGRALYVKSGVQNVRPGSFV